MSGEAWHTLLIGGGGFISGMQIVPDGTMVCRCDVFGCYRYSRDAHKWNQLVTMTSMPAGYRGGELYFGEGVYEISIAPSATDTMYMAYLGYVFKTTSQGASWSVTNFTRVVMEPNNSDAKAIGQKMAVDPANANKVYLGTQYDGLWVTTNGGTTWSLVSTATIPIGTGPWGVVGIAFDTSSGTTGGFTNTVYVCSTNNGIYRTTNAGSSWSHMTGSPTNVRSVKISATGIYYCTDLGQTNYYRYNGTWTNITPTATQWTAVAIDPFDETRICALRAGGYPTISHDGGTTWDNIPWGPNGIPVFLASDVPWQVASSDHNLGDSDCWFDPIDQNRLWTSAGTGCFYSDVVQNPLTESDWTGRTGGQESLVVNQIVSPPSGYPVVACWDRPLFTIRTPDAYQTGYGPNYNNQIVACWSVDYSASTPAFLTAVLSVSVGTAGDIVSCSSSDKGLTWTAWPTIPFIQGSSEGAGGMVACSTPTNWICAAANNGKLYYTLDAGLHWSVMTGTGVPTSGDIGWSFAYYLKRQVLAADRVTSGTFYAYNAAVAGVYKTTNGGTSWTKVYAGAPALQSGFNAKMKTVPGHAGHLFFTSGPLGAQGPSHPVASSFMRSSDGGATWTNANANILEVTDFSFGTVPGGGSYPTIWILGFYNGVFGVYYSNDNSVSWTKLDGYPLDWTDQASAVCADSNTANRLYIGYQGSGALYYGVRGSWFVEI